MEDNRFRKQPIEVISGRVKKGSCEIFRTIRGKVYCCIYDGDYFDPKTPEQQAVREDFRLAMQLTKDDLADPERRAIWEEKMREYNRSAYRVRVRTNDAGRIRWEDDPKHRHQYFRLYDFVKSQYKMAITELRKNPAEHLEIK